MQHGIEYFNQHRWPQAISLLGCCHDVGEWLIEQPSLVAISTGMTGRPAKLSAIDRYMVAGHLLSESFGRSQQYGLELHYLLSVHLKLLQRVKSRQQQYWLLKDHLEISLAMLKRYHQQHGQFKGYHDCYLETRLCIDQCTH